METERDPQMEAAMQGDLDKLFKQYGREAVLDMIRGKTSDEQQTIPGPIATPESNAAATPASQTVEHQQPVQDNTEAVEADEKVDIQGIKRELPSVLTRQQFDILKSGRDDTINFETYRFGKKSLIIEPDGIIVFPVTLDYKNKLFYNRKNKIENKKYAIHGIAGSVDYLFDIQDKMRATIPGATIKIRDEYGETYDLTDEWHSQKSHEDDTILNPPPSGVPLEKQDLHWDGHSGWHGSPKS